MRFALILRFVGVSCVLLQAASAAERTVVDNELGTVFSYPNGFAWTDVGAYLGAPGSVNFSYLKPSALKIVHARFHVFKPSDDYSWALFPYSKLRNYEAQEVGAGRPPIFVTATYAGKKRPVLWNWSLGLKNNVPTTPSTEWRYAVNVHDDRFVKFWINNYVRGILWKQHTSLQNLWVGLDECAFHPDLYGVLDDNNQFIAGVKWDLPFPQNENEYLSSIKTFFARAMALAPDLKLIPNVGSMKTWSRFPEPYGPTGGIVVEDLYTPINSAFVRNKVYNQLRSYLWASDQGKVTLLKATVPGQDLVRIRTAFLMYLLVKGRNSFYAPRIEGTSNALPPSAYEDLRSRLGNPVTTLWSTQEPGTPNPGFCLYWRQVEGGIVFLNWTGVTKTVPLSGGQLNDLNGNPITQMTIPDMTAACALYSKGPRAERPTFAPRLEAQATTPLTVSMGTLTPGAIIRYTLNATNPISTSPVYNGPITVSANTTIMAKTFPPTGTGSFNSRVTYTVTSVLPTVQFATASDNGPAGIYYPGVYYPVVKLSSVAPSTVTVQYTAQPLGGKPVQGMVAFKPGEQYRYFSIAASAPTVVTLSAPQGAVLGTTSVFTYMPQ